MYGIEYYIAYSKFKDSLGGNKLSLSVCEVIYIVVLMTISSDEWHTIVWVRTSL